MPMSRHHARHRQSTQPLQIVKRAATAAGFGVVTAAAVVGTSAAAWACPTGSHTNTGASVHRAVVHGHASTGEYEHATKHVAAHSTSKGSGHTTTGSGHTTDTTGSTPGGTASAGATRGASPSNPDGMSNGGVDKPWGGAAANDDTDGNNGSGNDADCEDDNNGVGTPGHCRTTLHHHGHSPTQGERGTHRHGAGCEHTAGQGTTGGTESGQSGSGQSGCGQSGSGQSGS